MRSGAPHNDAHHRRSNRASVCAKTRLEPVQELLALRPIHLEAQRFDRLRLRGPQEGQQFRQVHGVLAVVVLRSPSA